MKGKTLQAKTQKKSFLLRPFPTSLKLFYAPYPTKYKQALEEKN